MVRWLINYKVHPTGLIYRLGLPSDSVHCVEEPKTNPYSTLLGFMPRISIRHDK